MRELNISPTNDSKASFFFSVKMQINQNKITRKHQVCIQKYKTDFMYQLFMMITTHHNYCYYTNDNIIIIFTDFAIVSTGYDTVHIKWTAGIAIVAYWQSTVDPEGKTESKHSWNISNDSSVHRKMLCTCSHISEIHLVTGVFISDRNEDWNYNWIYPLTSVCKSLGSSTCWKSNPRLSHENICYFHGKTYENVKFHMRRGKLHVISGAMLCFHMWQS